MNFTKIAKVAWNFGAAAQIAPRLSVKKSSLAGSAITLLALTAIFCIPARAVPPSTVVTADSISELIYTGFPDPVSSSTPFKLETSLYGNGNGLNNGFNKRTDSVYPFGQPRSLYLQESSWQQDPYENENNVSAVESYQDSTHMDNDCLQFTLYPYPKGVGYDGGSTLYYVTGQQNSNPSTNGFKFQYGYIEACCQMAPGQGMWNAAWAFTTDSSSTTDKGEIDMVEQIDGTSSTNDKTYYSTLHYLDYGSTNIALPQSGGNELHSTADLTTAYHIYGVDWQPTQIIFYLDGVKTLTVNTTTSSLPFAPYNGQNPWQVPMSIISDLVSGNNASGGKWVGLPNSSTPFPATMYEKYMRVYKTSYTINDTGNSESSLAFALPATGTAQISGTAIYNTSGNWVSGMIVELCDTNKTAIATQTTTTAGQFTFGSLAAGTYYLHYLYPPNWVPASGGPTDNFGYTTSSITLTSGQTLTATQLGLAPEAPQDQGQPVYTVPTNTTSVQTFNDTITSFPGQTIYYTTDGTQPTTNSLSIPSGNSITIGKSETVNAMSTATNYVISPITSATYYVTGQLAGGDDNTVAIKSDGTVWNWGAPTATGGYESNFPSAVSPLTNIVNVSAGHSNQFAVDYTSSHNVWFWGSNSYGQAGNGGTSHNYTPSTNSSAYSWGPASQVAAGEYHTVVLQTNGTVWTAGSGGSGQLGTGGTSNSYTPVQAMINSTTPLTNVTSIGAGQNASYAVTGTGQLYAWGNNVDGQLGDGSTGQENYAEAITGATNVMYVQAGNYYAIFLRTDGTVWGMGNNVSGQLGDTTVTERKVPVQAYGLTNIINISCAPSSNHNVALKKDGTVWTWGTDVYGELGNGTTTNYVDTPVAVLASAGVTFTGASAVGAGGNQTMATGTNGQVWAWGQNNDGQLGNSTTNNAAYPVQSGSLILAKDNGWYHYLGLDRLVAFVESVVHPSTKSEKAKQS